MSRQKPLTYAAFLLGLVIACDSTQSGSLQAGASTADVAAFCDATCRRDQRCADPAITYPPFEQCLDSCMAKIGTNAVYRADAINALRDCYTTLACGQNDDQCLVAAVNLVTTTPESDPSYFACINRQDTCSTDGVSDFSDDHCVTQLILTTQARSAFEDCLALPCEQISACYDNLVGKTS